MESEIVESASFLRKTQSFSNCNAEDVNSSFSSQTTVASSGSHDGADPFIDACRCDEPEKVAVHKIMGFDVTASSASHGRPASIYPGYISNRRSAHSAVHPSVIEPLSQPLPGSVCQPPEPRCVDGHDPQRYDVLKRTSSLVRLSMTLDGKAKVTTNDDGSPSPPRVQPSALSAKIGQRSTLQRSTSLIASGSDLTQRESTDLLPWPRRTTSGRLRDARTWEFYCDSDARNALTAQAEQEQSGSAVGAIALIKSRNKKALASNGNKRNLPAARAVPVKRVKSSSRPEKPKLSRAISSMARMETVHANVEDQSSKLTHKSLDKDLPRLISRSPSGDSDKENWEPGTQAALIRRPRAPVAPNERQRPVLKENLQIISQASSLGAVLNRENVSPRRNGRASAASSGKDTGVAIFTGEASVPREEEDLDCVQNLLSLSQGAWR